MSMTLGSLFDRFLDGDSQCNGFCEVQGLGKFGVDTMRRVCPAGHRIFFIKQ